MNNKVRKNLWLISSIWLVYPNGIILCTSVRLFDKYFQPSGSVHLLAWQFWWDLASLCFFFISESYTFGRKWRQGIEEDKEFDSIKWGSLAKKTIIVLVCTFCLHYYFLIFLMQWVFLVNFSQHSLAECGVWEVSCARKLKSEHTNSWSGYTSQRPRGIDLFQGILA
jgi:hypothetical protein